jgi:hypothetical protein
VELKTKGNVSVDHPDPGSPGNHPHRPGGRKPAPGRLTVFFRRHGRIVTFAGATIVLATFIVKEGIREHLKNLTDTVDTAESVFLVRTDLEKLRAEVGRSRIASPAIPADITPFQIAARDVDDCHRSLDVVRNELEIIAGLINKLPDQQTPIAITNNGTLIEGFLTLNGQQPIPIWVTNTWYGGIKTPEGHWRVLEAQRKQLWKDEYAVRGLMRPDHSRDLDAASASRRLESVSFELVSNTQDFGFVILREAMKIKRGKEHSYDFFTNLSYGLYGLGWTLGLVGRIFGVPGLNGDD